MKISQCLEYRILPLQFFFFTMSGVWCPRDWKSQVKLLYSFFTIIQIIAGFLFWFSMLMNIILTGTNSELFFENIFAINVLMFSIYKEYFILKKRRQLENLLKLCSEDKWFKPRDADEVDIVAKYENETKWVTILYSFGIVSGMATKALIPMLISDTEWVLPMEAWYPYKIKNWPNYLLTYAQQLLGGIPLISLHICVDTLFVALVLQVCIKLKLLKHRLKIFAYAPEEILRDEKKVKIDQDLSKYAYKHDFILRLGQQVNSVFQGIMTGQVVATIPNICINVFLLSQFKERINLPFLFAFLCFASCLMEIFLFCWYGNKIILQSLDVTTAAYLMNWPSLNISSKKKLITIMIRTTRSLRFATGSFVMNMQSFLEIIKVSYSAFRVLQETS